MLFAGIIAVVIVWAKFVSLAMRQVFDGMICGSLHSMIVGMGPSLITSAGGISASGMDGIIVAVEADVETGTSTLIFLLDLDDVRWDEDKLLDRSLLVSEVFSVSAMKEPKTFVNSSWRLFISSSKVRDSLQGKVWAGRMLIFSRRILLLRARQSDRVTSI